MFNIYIFRDELLDFVKNKGVKNINCMLNEKFQYKLSFYIAILVT